jgi:hypothetical protein
MGESEKVKNSTLCKKLNDYLVENNYELYKYLADKKELKDFLIIRSNRAHDELVNAMASGAMDAREVSNNALFYGIQGSISEYVESLLIENYKDYYAEISKKPSFDIIFKGILYSCLDLFYIEICENGGDMYNIEELLFDRINEAKAQIIN